MNEKTLYLFISILSLLSLYTCFSIMNYFDWISLDNIKIIIFFRFSSTPHTLLYKNCIPAEAQEYNKKTSVWKSIEWVSVKLSTCYVHFSSLFHPIKNNIIKCWCNPAVNFYFTCHHSRNHHHDFIWRIRRRREKLCIIF